MQKIWTTDEVEYIKSHYGEMPTRELAAVLGRTTAKKLEPLCKPTRRWTLMREIKFRGKRVDNGEWVYGAYSWGFSVNAQRQHRTIVNPCGCNCIEVYKVDPATVGQYTGLRDKNGREIYEGDIVKLETVSKHRSIGGVRWTEFARYEFWHLRQDQGFGLGQRFNETEVIGNIHDNPELLEVAADD